MKIHSGVWGREPHGIRNGHNRLNKGGWGSEDVWERTEVGIVYRQPCIKAAPCHRGSKGIKSSMDNGKRYMLF